MALARNLLLVLMWTPMFVLGEVLSSIFIRDGSAASYGFLLLWPCANFFLAYKICQKKRFDYRIATRFRILRGACRPAYFVALPRKWLGPAGCLETSTRYFNRGKRVLPRGVSEKARDTQ